MKYTKIYLDNKKIEIFNSLLGKETIKVDDQIVSSKYSIFGADHHFSLKEEEELNHYQFKFSLGINGVLFDFYKNGKPIIESEKGGCLTFIFMMFIIGVAVGILKAIGLI
ncbi:hypothetical protein MM213_06985 [Belliella sp. R4-6]|uniref:Uncharacterized protein n=1 Tax=Belliella alkalica TaxID=1730871 RepID=A0ABS9VAY4_9BACT|nr:hypothetical protein [Belliella alkalica]MCH7413220.1 hypothetical protein [Belliella alkalica]